MAPGPGRPRKSTDVIDLVNEDKVEIEKEDVINLVSDEEESIPARDAADVSRPSAGHRSVASTTHSKAGTGVVAGTGRTALERVIEKHNSEVCKWLQQTQSQTKPQAKTHTHLEAEPQSQGPPQSPNRPTNRSSGFSPSKQTQTATTRSPNAYALGLRLKFSGDPCLVENCQSTEYHVSRMRIIYCHRNHSHADLTPVRQAGMTDAEYLEALTSSVIRTHGYGQRRKPDEARAESMDRMPDLVLDDRRTSIRDASMDRMPDLISDDKPSRAAKASQTVIENVPHRSNNATRVAEREPQASIGYREAFGNAARTSRPSATNSSQERRSNPPVIDRRPTGTIYIPDSSSDSDEVLIVSRPFPLSKAVSLSASTREFNSSNPIAASRREPVNQRTKPPEVRVQRQTSEIERRPADLAARVKRVLSEAEKGSTSEEDSVVRAEAVNSSRSPRPESSLLPNPSVVSNSALPSRSELPSQGDPMIATAHSLPVTIPIIAKTGSLEQYQASPRRMPSPAKRKRIESANDTTSRQKSLKQLDSPEHRERAQGDARSTKDQVENRSLVVSVRGDLLQHKDHSNPEVSVEQQTRNLTDDLLDGQLVPQPVVQIRHPTGPAQNPSHAHNQPVPRKKACAIKTTASPFARRRHPASSSRRTSATSALLGQSPLSRASKLMQPHSPKHEASAQANAVPSSDEGNLLTKPNRLKHKKRRIVSSSSSSSSSSSFPPGLGNLGKPNVAGPGATINAPFRIPDKYSHSTDASDQRVLPERTTGLLGRRAPSPVNASLGAEKCLDEKIKSAHELLENHLLQYNEDHDYAIKSRLAINRKKGTNAQLPLIAKRYSQSSSPFTNLSEPQGASGPRDRRPGNIALSQTAIRTKKTVHPIPQIPVTKYASIVKAVPEYEYYDRAGSNQLARNHLCLPILPNYVTTRGVEKQDEFEKDLHPENPYRDGLFHLNSGPTELQRDRFTFLKNLQQCRQLFPTIERFLTDCGCSLDAVLGVFLQGLKNPVPDPRVLERLKRARQDMNLVARPIGDYRSLARRSRPSSREENIAALVACIAFEDKFGYSIWLVAEQKAQTLLISRAKTSENVHTELLCRICFMYNCSKHGRYHDDGSSSDEASGKDMPTTQSRSQVTDPKTLNLPSSEASEAGEDMTKSPELQPKWDIRKVNTKQQVLSTKHRLEKAEHAFGDTNTRAPRSRHPKTPGSSPEVARKSATPISTRPDDGYRCSRLCSLDRKAVSAAPPQDIEQTLRTFSSEDQACGRYSFAAFRENIHVSCIISKILGKSCIQVFWLIENLLSHDEARPLPEDNTSTGPKRKITYGAASKALSNSLSKSQHDYPMTKRNIFYPCDHQGDCKTAQCQCFVNKRYCEKSCACLKSCERRFQGCRCKRRGKICRKNDDCPCWNLERECDPDLCGTCGAIEVLDPMRRHLPDIDTGRCGNVAIQLGRPCRLIVGDSQVAGLGLYAGQKIKAGQFLGEYEGELVSREELVRRENLYHHRERLYAFRLNAELGLDGEHVSNKLRFINNSLKENIINCQSETKTCNTIPRIAMFATKDVLPGDELFFNYGYKKKYIKHFLDLGENGLEPVVPKKIGPDGQEESGDDLEEDTDTCEDKSSFSEDSSPGTGSKRLVSAKGRKKKAKRPIKRASRQIVGPSDRPQLPILTVGLAKSQTVNHDDASDTDAWMDDAWQHALQQQQDASSDDDYQDESAGEELSHSNMAKKRKASSRLQGSTSAKSNTPNRAASEASNDLPETSTERGRRSRRGFVHFDNELTDKESQSPQTRGRRGRGTPVPMDQMDGPADEISLPCGRAAPRGRPRGSLLRESWLNEEDGSETRAPSNSTGKRKRIVNA